MRFCITRWEGDMSSSNFGFKNVAVAFAFRRLLMCTSEKLQHKYSDEHREHYRELFTDLNWKAVRDGSAEDVLELNQTLERVRIDTDELVASVVHI